MFVAFAAGVAGLGYLAFSLLRDMEASGGSMRVNVLVAAAYKTLGAAGTFVLFLVIAAGVLSFAIFLLIKSFQNKSKIESLRRSMPALSKRPGV